MELVGTPIMVTATVMEEVVERGLLEVMVHLDHVSVMEAMESSPTSQAV